MGLVALALLAWLYPFCTIIARTAPRVAYVYLVAITCARNVSATFAFTSSMVMLNVAAPREHIGAINGVGQTLASFVRGAGPALGGGLWSVSVGSGLSGSQFIVFAFISCVALAGNALYGFLDTTAR